MSYSVSGIKHGHYKRALQSPGLGGTLSELEIPKQRKQNRKLYLWSDCNYANICICSETREEYAEVNTVQCQTLHFCSVPDIVVGAAQSDISKTQ